MFNQAVCGQRSTQPLVLISVDQHFKNRIILRRQNILDVSALTARPAPFFDKQILCLDASTHMQIGIAWVFSITCCGLFKPKRRSPEVKKHQTRILSICLACKQLKNNPQKETAAISRTCFCCAGLGSQSDLHGDWFEITATNKFTES